MTTTTALSRVLKQVSFLWVIAMVAAVLTGASPGLAMGNDSTATGTGSIDVAKSISVDGGATWLDADSAPGPRVTAGDDSVLFRFEVANTGSEELENIALTDDAFPEEIDAQCAIPATLGAGASAACEIGPIAAEAGQHHNTATVTSGGRLPPDDPGAKYEFVFVFDNGAVAEGAWNGRNEVRLSEFSSDIGPDDLADTTHISCSDKFGYGNDKPDGWGEKGSPDINDDPGWHLSGVQIRKDGTVCLDGGTLGPEDSDDAFYLGQTAEIELLKDVSVDGGATWHPADRAAAAPTAIVGTDVVHYRFTVTNTGRDELMYLDLTDPGLQGAVDAGCSLSDPLAVGDSTSCIIGPYDAEAGMHHNPATVTAEAEGIHGTDHLALHRSYGGKHVFTFIMADGEIVEGTSSPNEAPVPGYSDKFHVSCSDGFGFEDPNDGHPDGWGQKGAPVYGSGDNGPVEDYLITKFESDDGGDDRIKKTCGHGDVTGERQWVTDSNDAYYRGIVPAVSIEKSTNGADADGADDGDVPQIDAGKRVRWRYKVENTGEVAFDLADVSVSDDQPGVSPTLVSSSDAGGDGVLSPDETWTYEAVGTALDLTVAAGVTIVPGCQTDQPTYENTGTVSVARYGLSEQDQSHYCNALSPRLVVEKYTVRFPNTPQEIAYQADSGPGPAIPVNEAVAWRYVVTNPGNQIVYDLAITDTVVFQHPAHPAQSNPVPVYIEGDGKTMGALDPGETWVFEAAGTAWNPGPCAPSGCTTGPNNARWGQYENEVRVTGKTADGTALTAADRSCYYAAYLNGIDIELSTNGQDADTGDAAPRIIVDKVVRWRYRVHNGGNVPLKDVTVIDEFQGQIAGPGCVLATGVRFRGDTDGDCILDQGEAWVYRLVSTAEPGVYESTATITGVPIDDFGNALLEPGTTVGDSDPSCYIGETDEVLEIQTYTVRDPGTPQEVAYQADSGPGPAIAANQPLMWRYVVINRGNQPFTDVVVTDAVLQPTTPPQPAATPEYRSGDDGDGVLDPGERWIYEAEGTAWNPGPCPRTGCPGSPIWGQYENKGTVTAVDPAGDLHTAEDSTCYFAAFLDGITILASTNNRDTDRQPVPEIQVGKTVRWRWRVSNAGNVPLRDVVVEDVLTGPGSEVTRFPELSRGDHNDNGLLDPGEAWVYRLSSPAAEGEHTNTATITGTPIDPSYPDVVLSAPVTSSDVSHYTGTPPPREAGAFFRE